MSDVSSKEVLAEMSVYGGEEVRVPRTDADYRYDPCADGHSDEVFLSRNILGFTSFCCRRCGQTVRDSDV